MGLLWAKLGGKIQERRREGTILACSDASLRNVVTLRERRRVRPGRLNGSSPPQHHPHHMKILNPPGGWEGFFVVLGWVIFLWSPMDEEGLSCSPAPLQVEGFKQPVKEGLKVGYWGCGWKGS